MDVAGTLTTLDSLDFLSKGMDSKIQMIKEEIKSLDVHDGVRLILLAQVDKLAMGKKEIDEAAAFIAEQLRRHKQLQSA